MDLIIPGPKHILVSSESEESNDVLMARNVNTTSCPNDPDYPGLFLLPEYFLSAGVIKQINY
jgi:hypothetical protein